MKAHRTTILEGSRFIPPETKFNLFSMSLGWVIFLRTEFAASTTDTSAFLTRPWHKAPALKTLLSTTDLQSQISRDALQTIVICDRASRALRGGPDVFCCVSTVRFCHVLRRLSIDDLLKYYLRAALSFLFLIASLRRQEWWTQRRVRTVAARKQIKYKLVENLVSQNTDGEAVS